MESPSPAFISKIYSRPKLFLPDSGITNVPDVASGAKDLTNKMIHSGSSLVTGVSRSHNENGALTETLFARAHSETRDNIQEEGSDFGNPNPRSAEFLSSKFSRTQSGESSNSSGCRYHSCRKESVPVGYQSRSQGSQEFTENTFARSHSGDISEDSLFRNYSGTSASYIEGWLSRSQGDENECRNVHENEGYAESVSTTTNAEDDGVLESGISGTHSEINRDISQVSLSRSQNDEPESRDSHKEFAEPILSRSRSAEDGGIPVGGISESNSKASRNSSLDDFSKIQRDQSQDSTDTIFSQGHTEGTQESNLHNYPGNSNTAYVEGSVSGSPSDEKKSVSKDGGFRTPSIRSTTLSDSVFIRSSTSVDEDLCEETDLNIHSNARESALGSNIPGDASPRREEPSLPELSGLHTTENRGIPGNNPDLFVHGRKSQSESGFAKNYTNRKGGLTQSVFARPHSVPDKADYSSSLTDGSEGFVKAVVSRINRGILEGSASRGQSSRRGGSVDVDLMKDQSKEIKESHGDKSGSDYDARSASERKESVSSSGHSRIEHEQAGSFSRNLSDSISPVETSTPIQVHRRKEDAAEHSFSRSHSGESGSFKAVDLLSRSSNEESRDTQEANISTSCDKENEKCTEAMISRNHSYKCAVTSHPRTESNKAEDF